MRVDLDERKIDFEMSEKTVSAPIGRKRAPALPSRPPSRQPAGEAKIRPSRAAARRNRRAYFPKDAVQRNAEVRKSREMKKALMSDARRACRQQVGKRWQVVRQTDQAP
jgi:ribonuclease R